jgi:hypothetical protein
MRYLQIKKGLYLAEQFVNTQPSAQKKVAGGLNHIWIYDRSGSMSGTLSGLARDLIVKAKEIPVGDTLTLGWFSSEGGEFNFMLKGFKITEKRDYKILEDTINKNKSTIGCTCFSEILNDTETVIKDLSALSKNFALCFFTDGYPVVSNYTREIQAINSAIDKISGKIASSLLVGYGDYYNKELMSQMAERFGGALIHSENLPAFSLQLGGFMKDARENGMKVPVTLDVPVNVDSLVFGINGQQINIYQPNSYKAGLKADVEFIPTQASRDSLYVLTTTKPSGEEVKLVENDLQRPTTRESMIRGVYGAAYLLTQKAKSDMALEVLSMIGDKDMIDSVSNAFTNAEYGRAEAKMQEAVVNTKRRFMQGINMNYLPKEDAFCVLDVVKLLMQDDEAYFYPYHPDFEYKRIGAGSKVKDGYPEFTPDKAKAKCALSKLNWNKSMLNLSVLAQIPGTIDLSGDYAKYGFAKTFPTHVFRNYALIKDGFLNVAKLPVSMSDETRKILLEHDLIENVHVAVMDGYAPVFTLDLTKVPVINRAIANGRTSATKLCQKAFRELELQATLKTLNFLQDQLDPEGKSKLGRGTLTPDQELYLETQGIGRNGFSPSVEKMPTTDYYMAKEFEIKMKGLSSLPSVKDVQEKLAKGSKLTKGMELVKHGLDFYDRNLKKSASEKMKLSWLEDQILKHKKELVAVRSDIQETKFAVILGKKWFDEFSSREKNTLTLGGIEYTLSVGETKVEL